MITKLQADQLANAYVSGWVDLAATLSYLSADAPTYVVASNVDLTPSVGLGMKLKFTQAGSTVYGFVTAISGSSVTLYCGTDYAVSGSAITSPAYSVQKAPYGFPISPTKWEVISSGSALATQASPVQNTWYNLNTQLLNVPIGAWTLSFSGNIQLNDSTSASYILGAALSTSGSAVTDNDLYVRFPCGAVVTMGMVVYRIKSIIVTVKTPYYLLIRTETASVDNIYWRGDVGNTIIRAVCAYL